MREEIFFKLSKLSSPEMPSVSGRKNLQALFVLALGFLCVHCVSICVPIFSEWRCERPHMVCSSRLIGFSPGK